MYSIKSKASASSSAAESVYSKDTVRQEDEVRLMEMPRAARCLCVPTFISVCLHM